MKIKFLSLVLLAVISFACSNEETIEVPDYEQAQYNNIEVEMSRTPGDGTFSCSFSWVAPQCNVVPCGGNTYHIYFQPRPFSLPLTEAYVNCIREEYFNYYCGMQMALIQPSNLNHDVWVQYPCPKDDVDITTNEDPRICVGSDCD